MQAEGDKNRINIPAQFTLLLCGFYWYHTLNTMRPSQNGKHFVDNIFKLFFLMKIVEFWLEFDQNNIPAQIQVMAWCKKRWKVIIWTSDGLVYWCTYATLSHNELTHCCLVMLCDVADVALWQFWLWIVGWQHQYINWSNVACFLNSICNNIFQLHFIQNPKTVLSRNTWICHLQNASDFI